MRWLLALTLTLSLGCRSTSPHYEDHKGHDLTQTVEAGPESGSKHDQYRCNDCEVGVTQY